MEPDYQQWDGTSSSHTEHLFVLDALRVCSHVTHTPPQRRIRDVVSEIYKHIDVNQQSAEMVGIRSSAWLPVSEWCRQASDVITDVACLVVFRWDLIESVVDSKRIINYNCELLVLRDDREVQLAHEFRRNLKVEFRMPNLQRETLFQHSGLWALDPSPVLAAPGGLPPKSGRKMCAVTSKAQKHVQHACTLFISKHLERYQLCFRCRTAGR